MPLYTKVRFILVDSIWVSQNAFDEGIIAIIHIIIHECTGWLSSLISGVGIFPPLRRSGDEEVDKAWNSLCYNYLQFS